MSESDKLESGKYIVIAKWRVVLANWSIVVGVFTVVVFAIQKNTEFEAHLKDTLKVHAYILKEIDPIRANTRQIDVNKEDILQIENKGR